MSVVKISSRKVQREIDFSTSEYLSEELHVFEEHMKWSIFEMLEILKNKKADCFSITKEKPFNYFYARVSQDEIFIRLQTSNNETEFKIPIEQLIKK